MPNQDQPAGVDRITAAPGSKEYEHQFACQRNDTIQRIARIPLVRVVCGVLTLLYLLCVVVASMSAVRTQLESGFDVWESLGMVGCIIFIGRLILLQGRVALYGRF